MIHQRFRPWLLVATVTQLVAFTGGDVGPDGLLSLLVAVPLTEDNEHVDPGWMHMASALMAVDHFNTRDPSVIPDLEALVDDCPIKFENVTIIDTGTNSHKAMQTMSQMVKNDGYFPDAIAGPYNELPTLELSALATGLRIPIVSHRASNYNLVLPDKHPYFTQLSADLYGEMKFLGKFLQQKGRTNYIAVVHSLDDAALQRAEIIRGILLNMDDMMGSAGSADVVVKTFSYLSPATPIEGSLNRDIRTALQGVQECGYRTIVWLTSHPHEDAKEMGLAAHDLQLDTGKHFWIIPGGTEISSIFKLGILYNAIKDEVWWRFLQGAAYLDQVERFEAVDDDAFNRTLHYQNASFVQRLRDANPIPNYFINVWNATELGSSFPPDDIFQLITYPNEGTSYMYDSIMTIGIGACRANNNKANRKLLSNDNATKTTISTPITGDDLLQGIQSAEFMGASGQVRFHNLEGNPGSRDGSTVYFGVFNLLPFGLVEDRSLLVEFSAFYHPDRDELREVAPFVYADGTTTPPKELRAEPPQNYLSPQARAAGLSLMGISLGMVFLSAVWTVCHRKHRVVVAGQPVFLYFICLGSAILSLLIVLLSFDESHGWDENMLDKACKAVPWLDSLGHILIYGSLFSKLWRVNKVLQFKRRQIKVQHVLWPAATLVILAIVVLSVWTARGDHGWERTVIDQVTGESIGRCNFGYYTAVFMIPLVTINLVPTVLTGVMAWKTSDVDDLYSESKWIFTLILVQVQVLLVGIPVVVLLQDLSTDGTFIGMSLIVVTFPMTNMGLIFGPKMFMVYQDGKPRDTLRVSRGEHSHVRVSGISGTEQPTNRPAAEDTCPPTSPAVPGVYAQTVIMQ